MQDFKSGTKELDEIKESLLRLKQSFVPIESKHEIITAHNEDISNHYDESSDTEKELDMQEVVESSQKKNNLFFIIQVLFTLSFLHMDKFFFHIEGIIGLIILWYSIIQKSVNIPNSYLYKIAMLALSIDAIFHTGFQELEVLLAGSLLTYQQLTPTSLIQYEHEEKTFHAKQESTIIFSLFLIFITLMSIF